MSDAGTRMGSGKQGIAQVDSVFRNGTVTVVSVLAGFSLSYATTWAAVPGVWTMPDMISLGILFLGVVLEIVALAAMLQPECLEIGRYRRSIRIFLGGLILVGLGVGATLVLDIETPDRVLPIGLPAAVLPAQ